VASIVKNGPQGLYVLINLDQDSKVTRVRSVFRNDKGQHVDKLIAKSGFPETYGFSPKSLLAITGTQKDPRLTLGVRF
jgi:hypothetical protein